MKSKNIVRYQAILAYDGTCFHGSQKQTPPIRTVQGEVEKALEQLGWQSENKLLFAGRTDAGVHASGQVIAFDLEWNHSEIELQRALNAILPQDIATKGIQRASLDFHPRYHAKERCYLYRIYSTPNRDPLRERYTWRIWPSLDMERLQAASQDLLGVHDFQAFGSPHESGGSTIREIRSAAWRQDQDDYRFEIRGNAFLYHMVRHIVEVLVTIGQERAPIDTVKQLLQNPSGPPAQGLAPAQGLVLKDVVYIDSEDS